MADRRADRRAETSWRGGARVGKVASMKRFVLVAVLVCSLPAAWAQEGTYTLDELMQSAQDWAKENLDEDVLRAIQGADQQKVQQFMEDIQKRFHGEYVVDLAALRETAKAILPVLEGYEETAPYAAWLKAQLDYLEAADQFRLLIPPPKVVPGQLPQRAANPSPQLEREVWVRLLSERPWPANAKPMVPRLKPIFVGQKVPAELVWMAEVESSFDPKARSPVGAAGLFQLMPATAKRYGLSRWPSDQRLQPEENARAAAQYLHYLHGRFKDWRLALASYNAGEGTVQKLLDKQKTKSFEGIASHLPAETQMYVPRIDATIQRREGVRLRDL